MTFCLLFVFFGSDADVEVSMISGCGRTYLASRFLHLWFMTIMRCVIIDWKGGGAHTLPSTLLLQVVGHVSPFPPLIEFLHCHPSIQLASSLCVLLSSFSRPTGHLFECNRTYLCLSTEYCSRSYRLYLPTPSYSSITIGFNEWMMSASHFAEDTEQFKSN